MVRQEAKTIFKRMNYDSATDTSVVHCKYQFPSYPCQSTMMLTLSCGGRPVTGRCMFVPSYHYLQSLMASQRIKYVFIYSFLDILLQTTLSMEMQESGCVIFVHCLSFYLFIMEPCLYATVWLSSVPPTSIHRKAGASCWKRRDRHNPE